MVRQIFFVLMYELMGYGTALLKILTDIIIIIIVGTVTSIGPSNFIKSMKFN
jgi:hypothetical protein